MGVILNFLKAMLHGGIGEGNFQVYLLYFSNRIKGKIGLTNIGKNRTLLRKLAKFLP